LTSKGCSVLPRPVAKAAPPAPAPAATPVKLTPPPAAAPAKPTITVSVPGQPPRTLPVERNEPRRLEAPTPAYTPTQGRFRGVGQQRIPPHFAIDPNTLVPPADPNAGADDPYNKPTQGTPEDGPDENGDYGGLKEPPNPEHSEHPGDPSGT
jgi:hypothetical protein